MNASPITAYARSAFTSAIGDRDLTFDVYKRGTGAPIVLLQELPGVGEETLRLADKLVDAGFEVTIPHLFGPIGRTAPLNNLTRVFCMRREFALFATRRSSPITQWLSALCRHVKAQTTHSGVGVIGMCLTGNFAISLMADESVLASVASQPSMPIGSSRSLHMSNDEIESAKARLATLGPMLAYRFRGDALCSAAKFRSIDAAFNDDAERVQLTTLPGNGHAVFTLHFVDEVGHPTHQALAEVIEYFRRRLTR